MWRNSMFSIVWQAAALALVILTTAVASAQPAGPSCSSVAYRGFDSRLDVELVGRVDLGATPVVGFEVVGGRPVIAFERRLLGIDDGRPVSMPSLEKIDALATDLAGRIWLQHGTTIRRVDKDRLETVGKIGIGARLHNSGNAVFVQSAPMQDGVRLVVHAGGAAGALEPIDLSGGKFAGVGWNRSGLAALVGTSLVVWPVGGPTITRLLDDEGLRSARDITLVSASRAVVALPDTLALVTERGIAVLALMRSRVRWDGNALYVLDEIRGAVWRVSGLDRLGSPDADKAHAERIMGLHPAGAPEAHAAFLEAARLIGCDGVTKLARGRR